MNMAADNVGVVVPRNEIGREEWKVPFGENDKRMHHHDHSRYHSGV